MAFAGQHYTDDKGARYFSYQAGLGEFGALADRFKFDGHTSPSDTVVDFGCGTAAILATLPAAERIGIEPNPLSRRAAAARGIRTVSSPRELEHNIADVVISNHALEHALSPYNELRAIRELLKPEGKLILWIPLDDWRIQKMIDPNDPNHHLYAWTPLLLGNLLTEVGYRVQECRVVAHAWPWGAQSLARLLPEPAFHVLCRVWARAFRRRQIAVIAVSAADPPLT